MIPNALVDCLQVLNNHARAADADAKWPAASWEALTRAGVLRWSIDAAHGGLAADGIQILDGLERLASACLTTCFLLSQREAAVRRLMDMAVEPLRGELLEPLADGRLFITVGLSQLTTSRQHGLPSLLARSVADGFVLDGAVPWVTGAARADHFVLGAATDDNRQVLLVVPATSPGVTVGPNFDLMALQGSLTAELALKNVFVPRRLLLAGPAEKVLSAKRGGAGGLETSCLALGLAGGAIDDLANEATRRAEWREVVANLEAERVDLRREMRRLAVDGGDADIVAALRTRANDLVLRATQIGLLAAKGAGYLRDHPAQRRARQALFFLVWSCPRPTVQATVVQLTRGQNS